MKNLLINFWKWYEGHYKLNLKIAAGLFLWQTIHLGWLLIIVVLPKIFVYPGLELPKGFNFLFAVVDYTEIPALLSVSLVYLNELRKNFKWKSGLYLLFLNSQWLHLFWITDEFAVKALTNETLIYMPLWLAWLAIIIDFLEIPVMYDTFKKYLTRS